MRGYGKGLPENFDLKNGGLAMTIIDADGASFGPDSLKAVGEAFDAAWAEVSGNFGDDMVDLGKARRRLAKALLSLANEDSRDVPILKRAALQRMALDYRRRR